MTPRDDSPLDYVGVSEGACQKRTKEITEKINGVSSQVTGIDKKLDVHLASIKGAKNQAKSTRANLSTVLAILAALIALGGIVWGAAHLAQPDVKQLAAELRHHE